MNHRVSVKKRVALFVTTLGLGVFAMFVSEAWAGGRTIAGLSFQLSQPPKAACLLQAFHIWQEPDPFFKNLKQVKSKRTLQYRRGHDIVANYPDSTIVRVVFWQGVSGFNLCNALPSFDPAKVKFHLEWQNDSQIVRAKGHFVLSEESSPQTWCEDTCAGHWTYELRIDSQNVPLQDSLVVRIDTQNGTRLVEYVGKLSTANQPQQPVPASP